MALCKLGGKLPVSIKHENLHSFKEGVTHLCQSILETRRISHLHGSALFTISLKTSIHLKRLYSSENTHFFNFVDKI